MEIESFGGKPAAGTKVNIIERLQEKGAMHLNCYLYGKFILPCYRSMIKRTADAFTKSSLSNFR